jgi:hypothetical protein
MKDKMGRREFFGKAALATLAGPAALEGGHEKGPCNGPINRWREGRRGKDEKDLC